MRHEEHALARTRMLRKLHRWAWAHAALGTVFVLAYVITDSVVTLVVGLLFYLYASVFELMRRRVAGLSYGEFERFYDNYRRLWRGQKLQRWDKRDD